MNKKKSGRYPQMWDLRGWIGNTSVYPRKAENSDFHSFWVNFHGDFLATLNARVSPNVCFPLHQRKHHPHINQKLLWTCFSYLLVNHARPFVMLGASGWLFRGLSRAVRVFSARISFRPSDSLQSPHRGYALSRKTLGSYAFPPQYPALGHASSSPPPLCRQWTHSGRVLSKTAVFGPAPASNAQFVELRPRCPYWIGFQMRLYRIWTTFIGSQGFEKNELKSGSGIGSWTAE